MTNLSYNWTVCWVERLHCFSCLHADISRSQRAWVQDADGPPNNSVAVGVPLLNETVHQRDWRTETGRAKGEMLEMG